MGYRNLIVSVILLILIAGVSVWLLMEGSWWLLALCVLFLVLLVYRIISIYTRNISKLNYLLGAFENGDLAFHFAENSTFLQDRVFNILLNRVRESCSTGCGTSFRGSSGSGMTARRFTVRLRIFRVQVCSESVLRGRCAATTGPWPLSSDGKDCTACLTWIP